MQDLMISLFTCSVTMSALALFYMAITPLLSKRYSAKGRYYTWLIIIIGLIIPFRPQFDNAILKVSVPSQKIVPAIQFENRISLIEPAPLATPHPASPSISVWHVLMILWLVGMIAFLSHYFIKHYRFIKFTGRWSESIRDENVISMLENLKTEMGISKNVNVRLCASAGSPMMIGFVRPKILLPQIDFSPDELRFIFTHELVHYKRKDLWYKMLTLLATAIHWFNPIVYMITKVIDVQCELSCDNEVIHHTDGETRQHYSETIIGVVKYQSKLKTPLSTSFYGGKKGIKKRILSIMDMNKKKTGAILLCWALFLTLGTGFAFAANAVAENTSKNTPVPNTVFTDEEYDQLFALEFDGYENMTVSEFQGRVWELRDTTEYMNLLERFSQDEMLYAMKDSNETASFLFNILKPLTAEKWQSRDFGGYVSTNYDASDNAMLEYWLTMEILDANKLTVGQYNDTRLGVVNAMELLLQNMSLEELKTDQQDSLQSEINRLTQTGSSDSLQLSLQFVFTPLSGVASDLPANNAMGTDSNEQEPRQYEYGTPEDYTSLLVLMTPNYQQMTVSDFNAVLLDWGNENYDRWDRIREDAARNDYQVALTDDERSFVALTMRLSGEENFRMIQSLKTGDPEEIPGVGSTMLLKESRDSGRAAWCSLYYQLPYQIADKDKLTVGERDRCIGGMINAIQAFWDKTSLDDLLMLTEGDIEATIISLAEKYSSDLITIHIDENQLQFEGMDERNLLD